MLTVLSFLIISVNSVFATPINDLERGDTAIGVIGGSNNSTYYLESQNTENLIIGIQSIDLNESNAMDFYAQLRINENLRAIVGNRSIDSTSKTYAGAAIKNPLTLDIDAYASVIAGSGFQELQLGANYKLTDTNDLNINFSKLTDNKSSIGIGLSCRF